ncbi:MAG: hypothetical protein ACOC5T_09690, partial [Elusimicrobiota bacterium]
VKYIKKLGWRFSYFNKELKGKKHTGITCLIKGKKMPEIKIYIIPYEGFLEFAIYNYIRIPSDSRYKVFKFLLEKNTSPGKFLFDPQTNNISFQILYPSIGSKINFKQFHQVLLEMLSFADDNYPIIKSFLSNEN